MTRSDDLLALWEVRDRFVEGDRWFERALELPGDLLSAESGVALDARASPPRLSPSWPTSRPVAFSCVMLH